MVRELTFWICISLAIRILDGERINLSQGVPVKERMWALLFHFSRSLCFLCKTPLWLSLLVNSSLLLMM